MKRLGFLLIFLSGIGLLTAADPFWKQLTPEERQAAGLDQLTPEQQAALDKLAERFAREGARQAVVVAKEQAKAEFEVENKKHEAARVGLPAKEGSEVVESKIAGTFKGWSGRTLFTLENGQSWVQIDTSDSYWVGAQPGPEVEIKPSSFGGWKLTLKSNGRWVRVKRVN